MNGSVWLGLIVLVSSINSWVSGMRLSVDIASQPAPFIPLQPVLNHSPAEISDSEVRRIARSITVKIVAGETWGSGILIQQQGQTYTVVTNDHVLIAADSHRVQTPDGKLYAARVDRQTQFGSNDLGLVQFTSSVNYSIATLGAITDLTMGDRVFASGFPVSDAIVSTEAGFAFLSGQVSLIPPKALNQGYQLGYTNPIEKGMSGGPVLNTWGQVVGINGRHAYPLWGDPYVFEDGSRPCPTLQQQMAKISWAIPVERLVMLAPQFFQQRRNRFQRDPTSTQAPLPECHPNQSLLTRTLPQD